MGTKWIKTYQTTLCLLRIQKLSVAQVAKRLDEAPWLFVVAKECDSVKSTKASFTLTVRWDYDQVCWYTPGIFDFPPSTGPAESSRRSLYESCRCITSCYTPTVQQEPSVTAFVFIPTWRATPIFPTTAFMSRAAPDAWSHTNSSLKFRAIPLKPLFFSWCQKCLIFISISKHWIRKD